LAPYIVNPRTLPISLRHVVAILASVVLLLGYPSPANAWVTDSTCRWTYSGNVYLYYEWGPEIDYTAVPADLSWRSAFQYAAADWSATPTKLYVVSGGSDLNFDTYYALDGTRGKMALMQWTAPANCLKMFPRGNRAYYRSLYEAEHTANHEIGHGLPLAHSQYNNALMWDAYNAVGVPQTDDINGVNWMYP